MILNSIELKKTPFNQFYKRYIQSDIKCIKNKYQYVCKTKEELDDLIENMARTKYIELVSFKVDEPIDFGISLSETINNYIKEKLEKEDIESLEIFDRYIKENIKIDNMYSHMKRQLDRISNFFTEIDYLPSVDRYMELIKSNSQFSKILEVVFNKNKSLLTNYDANNLENNNIMAALEAYAFLNDVELEETNNIEEISKEILEPSGNTDALRLYLNSLNRPILTKNEEHELFIKARNGDKQARDKIIESNLRLVINVAKKYMGMGVDLLDLIQEGNIGVMTAVDRFDPEKGYKFSTYAMWWIRQKVSRCVIQDGRAIRLSTHMYEKINKYNYAKKALAVKLGRVPTSVEMARELNIPVKAVSNIELTDMPSVSISMPITEDEDSSLEDVIPSLDKNVEQIVEERNLPDLIEEVFKKVKLDERAIEIIKMRQGFYNDEIMTLNTIAEKFGLSRERISQIEMESYRKILDSKYKKLLLDYSENPDKVLKNLEVLKNRRSKKATQSLRKQKKPTTPTSLYSYFKDYDLKDVEDIINNLPARYMPLLHERYGEDLANPVINETMSYNEKQKIYNTVIPYIRRRLEERQRKELRIITPLNRENKPLINYYKPSKEDYLIIKELLLSNNCKKTDEKNLLATLIFDEDKLTKEKTSDQREKMIKYKKELIKKDNTDSVIPKILVK